jgi:hypothetical protein
MNGYRVRVQRLIFTDVELNADTPGEAVVGAMQVILQGEYPDDLWIAPDVSPKTIRPMGAPQQIPLLDVGGQEAFTTDPEIPPDGLDVSGVEFEEEEEGIPEEGLVIDDDVHIPPQGMEVEDDGPHIPADGLPVPEEMLAGAVETDEDDDEEE